MLGPISLDDQKGFGGIEINNEMNDWFLSIKLNPKYLFPSQSNPELFFRPQSFLCVAYELVLEDRVGNEA